MIKNIIISWITDWEILSLSRLSLEAYNDFEGQIYWDGKNENIILLLTLNR